MRVSAGLPTGMEGLTYPIPFSDPENVIRIAQAAEKFGYDFGVGQRPHDDPELRARRVPGAAALLGAADHLRLRAVGDQDDQGRHRRPGAADAPRHRGDGQADRHARPFRQGPAGDRRRHRRLSRGIQGAAARRQDAIAATSSTRACRRCNLLFKERVASFDGQYYKFRDVELYPKPLQKQHADLCRRQQRQQHRAAPSSGPTAGCRPACMSTACAPA